MEFTIGADPEFFLKNKHRHISAVGMIGGNKDYPLALPKEGFAILEDNVSVEFNIAPCHNHTEFIDAIQYVMKELQQRLPNFEFSTASSVVFDADQLNDPQALEFGCEPDLNAWTKQQNPRPTASNAQLRSAGGHVHVGTNEDPFEVIKAMDVYLGIPSLKIDNSPAAIARRQLYGKAGCCRIKPYGAEYRTLSNFWIFSPKLIEWVYNQTEKALAFVAAGNRISVEDGHLIQDCINNNNGKAYEHLSKTYGLA